jgi:hypothetical protein
LVTVETLLRIRFIGGIWLIRNSFRPIDRQPPLTVQAKHHPKEDSIVVWTHELRI